MSDCTSQAKLSCFLLLQLLCISAQAAPMPVAAPSVISKVHTAAKHKDFAALKSLMVNEFIWSFGGDGDADHAISAWQADPTALKHLQQITHQPCVITPEHFIECPRNAGKGYRAGFKQTNVGWRMFYFVGGD